MAGVVKALLYAAIATLVPYSLCAPQARAESPLPHLPDETSTEPTSRPEFVSRKAHFRTPSLSLLDAFRLSRLYSYVDPLQLVPQNLEDQALAYFHVNLSHIANPAYLSIVDFSKPSN